MTATTEEAALLAAVAADPPDDTVRLAYADWLQEQPAVRMQCGWCSGKGHGNGFCACWGTGSIIDNSHSDRAEFIRLQAARIPELEADAALVSPRQMPSCQAELDAARSQSERLLSSHRSRWSQAPCPDCGGLDWWKATTEAPICTTCSGQGDLLKLFENTPTQRDHCVIQRPRKTEFARGFVYSVECRLAELGTEREAECDRCTGTGVVSGYYGDNITTPVDFYERDCPECAATGRTLQLQPSKWALAVVRALPVTEFRLTGKQPEYTGSGYHWNFIGAASEEDDLPWWLWSRWSMTAFSTAAARVVRKAAYQKEPQS